MFQAWRGPNKSAGQDFNKTSLGYLLIYIFYSILLIFVSLFGSSPEVGDKTWFPYLILPKYKNLWF